MLKQEILEAVNKISVMLVNRYPFSPYLEDQIAETSNMIMGAIGPILDSYEDLILDEHFENNMRD